MRHVGTLACASGSDRRAVARRGFTLVELLVSLSILILTLTMIGMIFSVSSKATGMSQANNENLNKLRAFEQQIRRDLQGIRKDAFVGLCYNYMPAVPVDSDMPDPVFNRAVRADWIVFFADGEFETIRQRYTPNINFAPLMPMKAKLARIQYGMMGTHRYLAGGKLGASKPLAKTDLGRFAKLQTSDSAYPTTPNPVAPYGPAPQGFVEGTPSLWDGDDCFQDLYENWEYENLAESMAAWRSLPFAAYTNRLVGIHNNAERANFWLGLGYLDPMIVPQPAVDPDLRFRCDHLRMLPGCVGFRVQRWAETNPVTGSGYDDLTGLPWQPRWWPEDYDKYIASGNHTKTQSTPPSDTYRDPNDNMYCFGPDPTGVPVNSGGSPSNWPGLRMWECFNSPVSNDLNSAPFKDDTGGTPPWDWPQRMDDTTTKWPWITRDFTYHGEVCGCTGNTLIANANAKRAIYAAFPKALKFTITMVDENRRMRPSQPNVADKTHIDGSQEFTIVVVLE